MNNVLAPVTKSLKANTFEINMVMLIVVLFFLFPVKQLFSSNAKDDLKRELSNIVNNPVVRIVLCLFLVSIYSSGNLQMMVLFLFLIHHLLSHNNLSP